MVGTVGPALVVMGSGVDEMAAVELELDVDGAKSDVLPPPHTQHATRAVVPLAPTASAKSVLHSSRNSNDVHVYTLLPIVTPHSAPRLAHDGSTNTVGAGVVVALVGEGVVELVGGSGDDMASVELEYSGVGASEGANDALVGCEVIAGGVGCSVGGGSGVGAPVVPGVGCSVGGGSGVGDAVSVGAKVGDIDAGAAVGAADASVGAAEGAAVGALEGGRVDGAAEGAWLGTANGALVGATVGAAVGASCPVVPPPQLQHA